MTSPAARPPRAYGKSSEQGAIESSVGFRRSFKNLLCFRRSWIAKALYRLRERALERYGRRQLKRQLEWKVLPDMAISTAAALTHAAELAETMIVDQERMAGTLASTHSLLLAEAVSFALSEHMERADAQALVKNAVRCALDSGRDLLEVVTGLSDAPVAWSRLRAQAEKPHAADPLVQRVLKAAADSRRKAT